MYILLISPTESTHQTFLSKWERDLNCTFTSNQTQRIITFTLQSYISTKVQKTNYKLLTRWYLTPQALHTYQPNTSALCWRCQGDRGTLLHIFWSCPKLSHFWSTVRATIQKFTDYNIPDDPAFFLLHVNTISTKRYKKSIVRHLLNAAKSCIPLQWKSQTPPTVASWIQRVEDISKMEDLVLNARHQQEKYNETWALWHQFILSPEGIILRTC